ncbi:MAG: META domain-containing protein [Ilumatobacteraceae bacterium]
MKLRIVTSLLVPALVLTLAACGDDTVDTADTAAAGSDVGAAIEGRTYISQSATGFTLVDGSDVRLTFEGGKLAAGAGCNMMNGSYTIADGILTVGAMMSTMMACEQPLMDQETAVSAFLTSGPTITADGDALTLVNADITMQFLDRKVAEPDLPLADTTWTVSGIISADAVSSTTTGTAADVTFTVAADGTGTAAVNAGCNTGSAEVTVGDGTITFGPLALTKKMCDEAAMELEAAVSATMTGDATYEIEANSLTIMSGATGLTFTAGS